jgi:TetR/AcrR family transcriptional repressor of nem operon
MKQLSRARPLRGRPREFDSDDVVERAMGVFWSNGYHGTSLPNLLEATGLSRGSLYDTFGDKRGLFLLALDRYIQVSLARFDEDLDIRRSAVDGLLACLTGYVARTTGVAGRRGCLVVATAMELASHDLDIEKRLSHFFKAAEGRLAGAFARARAESGPSNGIDPASAARVLLSTVEGIRVIAKTGIDRAVWQKTIAVLLSALLK